MTVLVAGAGPVGLTLAVVLARAGLSVQVVEKRAGLSTASRASTFHPPTLEILEDLECLAAARPAGRRVDAIQYREVGDGGARLAAHLDLGLLGDETRFPFRLHLEQSRLTPVLLEELTATGRARVDFEAEVDGLEVTDDGVRVTLRRPGGVEHRRAGWVVGADGARSAVREAAGIGFSGHGYAHRVLRVMTPLDLRGLVPGLAGVAYLYRGQESVSLLEMVDGWRVIFRVPASMSDDVAQDRDRLRGELARFLPGGPGAVPIGATDVYAVSHGVADAYRAGRVLLAGDAAHLTNTRGGMNMNCGIHDAVTLGAALAAPGPEREAALDGYARERRRVAVEELVPRTDRTVTGGPAWLAEMAALARDPAAVRAYLRSAAMLDMAPPRAPAGLRA